MSKKKTSKPKAKGKGGRYGAGRQPPRLRQQPLIADARIQALEDIGARYAEIRDERIELGREEKSLKTASIKHMHLNNKKVYDSRRIKIVLTEKEEDVKVTLKKPADLDAADSDPDVDFQVREDSAGEAVL